MSEPLSDGEIAALRSILRGLTGPEWRALKTIASAIAGTAAPGAAQSGGAGPTVASDADLDSAYGDPTVRKDPKRWAGASYVGAHYSQCPSDYLLVMAESLEYFADRDAKKPEPKRHRNGTPYYEFDRRDAARARGWANRNRGKALPPPEQTADGGDEMAADMGSDAADMGDSAEGWVP